MQAESIVDATAADVAFLKACKLVGAKTNMQSSVQVSGSCGKHAPALFVTLAACPNRCITLPQLWSVNFTAEVLLQLGERQDVVDAVLSRGSRAQGENISAERAALLMSLPCSPVIQLPPTLPTLLELAATWSTATYGLSLEEWNKLEASSEFKARPAARSSTPATQLTAAAGL
jgi:hypothetical protein